MTTACSSTPYLNVNPVHLENNKYTTLLIAINEEVVEDPALVEILEFDKANVIVDDETHPDYGDGPYVKQLGDCGEKGEYLHLTPTWILDRTWSEHVYGDSGKVLVHEWGHLQWGLFDEYPTDIKDQYYVDGSSGKAEATRCSLAITGKSCALNDNERYDICEPCTTNPEVLPDANCVFLPDEPNEGTGSYMYASYLESVIHFCRSQSNGGHPHAEHNPEAPNDQNKMCTHKSAWDIMEESVDFWNNNPPNDELDTMPQFKIVRESEFRTVLVMDISGSMSSYNRIDDQLRAATTYIRHTLPLNSWVGIVEFETRARILAPLTRIVDDTTREELIELLPSTTTGRTCIGCGLETGIDEVFEESQFGNAAGGVIFLTTDGAENERPYIEDVLLELIEKEVIVGTLAFSESADPKLVGLSNDTGGIACWYSGDDNSTALNDCFTASLTERTSSSKETPVQLTSYKATINGLGTEEDIIYIDSTIGRDTIFFFFWDFSSSHEVDVIITRPNGTTIDSTDPQYNSDTTTRSIHVKIDGIAEVGEWTYQIFNPDSKSQVVEVAADSKSVDSTTHPIRLSANPSTDYVTESPPMVIIYAELHQGYSPVLKAKVIATVERPSPHSLVDVQLSDSATGADIKKDDGVYSSYFLDFVEATCATECRYSIQVNADNEDGTADMRMTSRAGAMPRNYTIPRKEDGVPVGDFNRVVHGGMIQVDGAVDYVDWSDPNDDPFPPARIMDLRVTNTSYDDITVSLQWTATGDDMDKGTASIYDLRYATNFSQITNDFDGCDQLTDANLTDGTLLEPKESGQTEKITAMLPSSGPGVVYYFSIRAVDDVGNAGDSSNLVQTTIVPDAPPVITTQTIPTTSAKATSTTTSLMTTESSLTTLPQKPISNNLEGWQIALRVLIICVLMVIVLYIDDTLCVIGSVRHTIITINKLHVVHNAPISCKPNQIKAAQPEFISHFNTGLPLAGCSAMLMPSKTKKVVFWEFYSAEQLMA
ncbi:calcium-activated chloride channel regulator 1-like [Glandiceps talaboti]